jgi:hypothetical protein
MACRPRGRPRNWASAAVSSAASPGVLIFFHLQCPPVFGWSATETLDTLTNAAV